MTQAEHEITVAPITAVPAGEGRTFLVGDLRLAIFHMRDGQVFATQADCPHKNGPLSDGLIGNGVVLCPLHSWKFDLATGQALFGDCGIKTYPARLDEHAQIVVQL